MNEKTSFEDFLPIIESLIARRRYKWQLNALQSMDYDDVSQIILLHIWEKFYQFNPAKGPIEKWANRIISNQIYNLIRNNYASHARPCVLGCVFNGGGEVCLNTPSGKQCSECLIYKKWEKTKKRANEVKLPLTLENHIQEVYDKPDESCDISKATENMHIRMKKELRNSEFRVYKLLYIDGKSEEETAKILGFCSNEGRKSGYGRLRQIQKIIWEKANKIKDEIDFF